MMADVKLLGAHVDHLINVQQRLLDKAGGSTVAESAGDSENGRQWPEPSPFDSVDAWATHTVSAGVTREADAWPSQPYNPARYSGYGDCQQVKGTDDSTGPGTQSRHRDGRNMTGEAAYGSSSITAELNGYTFNFLTEANKQAFTQDPWSFAPAWGGF